MLRRNLLKSLTAIIPLSLLNKNANANLPQTINCEDIKDKLNTNKIDPDYTWEIQIKNKDGKIIKVERSDGWWGESTYDEHGKK